VCEYCGEGFFARSQDVKDNKARYCSLPCVREDRRQRGHIRNTAEDFWKHVEQGPDCWLYIGALDKDGYGRANFDGASVKAHRLAWILTHGPIPDGILICHHCDVRNCVRPDHLFEGTPDDNSKDMVSKERQAKGERMRAIRKEHAARGERCGSAKLTERDVREIRANYAPTRGCATRLSVEYGVGITTIRKIIRRETWQHVE
jgi:hypothetical protein